MSRFCPLFVRPQNNHKLHAFSLTGKVENGDLLFINPRMLCTGSEGLAHRVLALPEEGTRNQCIGWDDHFFFLPSYVGIEFMRCRLQWFFSGKANWSLTVYTQDFQLPNNLKSPVHDLFDYKLPIHSYEFRNALVKKMKKKLKQTKRGYRTQYKL